MKTVVAAAATVFLWVVGRRSALAQHRVGVGNAPVTCHMSHGVGEVWQDDT